MTEENESLVENEYEESMQETLICPVFIFFNGTDYVCKDTLDCVEFNKMIAVDEFECATLVSCPAITYMLSLKTFECITQSPTTAIRNYFNSQLVYKTCPVRVSYEVCVAFCT